MSTTPNGTEANPTHDLAVARELAAGGIPLFVAAPDPSHPTGFALPTGWQRTACDASVVDAWRPGMALCAVMGHGLDLIDFDPRSGGDPSALRGAVPISYGIAATPSGGLHSFVASLGVRSRDNVAPGIDVKSGEPDGRGRGFAFVAPTVRASKVDGTPRPYRWIKPPELARWRAAGAVDTSGAALRALIASLRAGEPNGEAPTPESFMRVSPWSLDVGAVLARGRHAGVVELAGSLRGRGGWRLADALAYMRAVVWPAIDQAQSGHEYTAEEFEKDITDVWERWPDGAAERAEQDAAILAAPASPERVPVPGHVMLTDAYLADRVSEQHLFGRYLWVPNLGWLRWDGRRWVAVDSAAVVDTVRQWTMAQYERAQQAGADSDLLKILKSRQQAGAIKRVAELCQGVACVRAEASHLDARPDLLNTPDGVVNLATGEIRPHDPALLLTKITRGSYRAGYTHPDWDTALGALPEAEREWLRGRVGQAITGYPAPDGVMPVLQGGGENGKSALTTDGVLPALGDYAAPASAKLLQANEHSTERADLRGRRLVVAEELTEGRALNVTALKQIQDVGQIRARYLYRDNITFTASHTLFVTTNYLPVVAETDHGTWRRLVLLRFPYTFRKPGEPLTHDYERAGDPGLKTRIREGKSSQHDAIVTWAVDGALRWYNQRDVCLRPTAAMDADTLEWRAEADQILGYWRERLIPDPDTCVTRMDVFDDFNDWLRAAGKAPWSRETFSARFIEHLETKRHNVTERRMLNPPNLVRRATPLGMPRADTQRFRVYLRIRFRTTSDESDLPGSDFRQESTKVTDKTDTSKTQSNTNTGKIDNGIIAPTCGSSPGGQGGQGLSKLSMFSGARAGEQFSVDRASLATCVSPGQPWFDRHDISGLECDYFTTFDGIDKPRSKRAEDKARLLGELAGPIVELPALVTRAGDVVSISFDQADVALGPAAAEALTVDVETSGYPVGHRHYRLRTVQLGNASLAVVFDVTEPAQAEYVRGVLGRAVKLHAHSATADIVPLVDAGLIDADRAWALMFDTVINAKLADPSSTGSDPALKRLADVVLPDAVSTAANMARAELFKLAGWLTETKVTTPIERSGWAQVDSRCRTMVRYAAGDVLDTAALAGALPPVAPALLARERAVQRLTARVTHAGLRIDGAHVAELLTRHRAERDSAGERVRGFGVDNPGSSAQIAAWLAERGAVLPTTDTGRPSATAHVLKTVQNSHAGTALAELAGAALAYREHDTAIGLFLEPYQDLVLHGDGRARPTVYTLAADTGRMSCVRPNFQQVPRTGGFRSCVTADPGELLISADFSGVELRVMAALSQDANLIRLILEGQDVHAIVAEQVFGPEWTKGDRYTVKRGVFGWAYGGSIPALARQVGCSESIMASVVDVLALIAPQYVAWSSDIKALVRSGRCEFETYSGRIAHLPVATPHKGPNYCVQGTARELLVDGLLRWRDTAWGDARFVPVHDEIVAVVPAEEAEKATRALVESMTTTLLGVPIVAEPSTPSFAWPDAA